MNKGLGTGMKTKRVNQYQCEFCGKKNYSAPHMKNHEKHCTMNPDRECKMCARLVDWAGLEDERPVPMSELLELLPKQEVKTVVEIDPDPFGTGKYEYEDYINTDEINNAIKILKKRVEDCPACVLAALRQKKIIVPTTDFDYQSECREFWNNDEIF